MHSTTILLPAWKETLEDLEYRIKIMPRDVATRWNSTFDMLRFSVEYRKAIEEITSDRKNDLRQFELSEDEWSIVEELKGTLEVGCCGSMCTRVVDMAQRVNTSHTLTDLEGCHRVLLTSHAQPCHHYPCDGPY